LSEGVAKKEDRRKFQAIKGTRDLLPQETWLWNRVEQTGRKVFGTFGFGEIRLPVFEPTELFARAVGGETDIVSKEMYTFLDRTEGLPEPKPFVAPRAYTAILEQAMDSGLLPPTPTNKQLLHDMKNEVEVWPREGKAGQIEASYMKWAFALSQLQIGESVSLRPEATASVCRAYIEHNMNQLPQPVKLYYMGPMFRRERPQKGRYRQFYQIGAEILGGTDAPAIDAEIIEMVMTFLGLIELQNVRLDINSIGHNADNCRRGYVENLRAELLKGKDKLGTDSQRRIETNPLRVLDSKLEHEQSTIERLPRIVDHLCDDCKTHYSAVKRELDLRGVKYHENWRLVRGLDYYMRTTFEITAQGLGSQNAVCGGGRYDGLVELLGGPRTKGIGFAIGEDRLILSLQEAAKSQVSDPSLTSPFLSGLLLYVAWMGQEAYATAIRAAKNLRNAGFSVELPPVEQKFGKALGQADKLGARFALILGDNEVSSKEWTLKSLADGKQQKLTESQLLDFLRGL